MIDRKYSVSRIADTTEMSPSTVRYWLKKYNLTAVAGKTGRPAKLATDNTKHCPACDQILSKDDFYKRGNRPGLSGWCKSCSIQVSLMRQKENKQRAVDARGGRCQSCGYSRCLAALEWHHPDPTKKDPSYRTVKTASWDTYWAEVSQCVLLCANCHREEHIRLNALTN